MRKVPPFVPQEGWEFIPKDLGLPRVYWSGQSIGGSGPEATEVIIVAVHQTKAQVTAGPMLLIHFGTPGIVEPDPEKGWVSYPTDLFPLPGGPSIAHDAVFMAKLGWRWVWKGNPYVQWAGDPQWARIHDLERIALEALNG